MKRMLDVVLQDAGGALTRKLYSSRGDVVLVDPLRQRDDAQVVQVTLLDNFDPHEDYLMTVTSHAGRTEFERLIGCRRGYFAATFPERWRSWLHHEHVHTSAMRYLVTTTAALLLENPPSPELLLQLSSFDETSAADWFELTKFFRLSPRKLFGEDPDLQAMAARLALAISARQPANLRWKPPVRRPKYDPLHRERVFLAGPRSYGC